MKILGTMLGCLFAIVVMLMRIAIFVAVVFLIYKGIIVLFNLDDVLKIYLSK